MDHAQSIDKVISWAYNELCAGKYIIKNSIPEKVLNTPWSYVARFESDSGYIYLKQMPEKIALEAIITKTLYEQFNAPVPKVIAYNTELNCFLMEDAGKPLRSILKENFDVNLYCTAINKFTETQIKVADHVEVFSDIGVPTWNLSDFPDLFAKFLLEKELLLKDGLTAQEISDLSSLTPKISSLCKELASYSITETIVQCDFHDNNIVVDQLSETITLIDLGEIVITHPFFPFVNCLWQLKKHHGVTDEDENYQKIKDACLSNYKNIYKEKDVLDAFLLVSKLWPIYDVFSQYRLIKACDASKITLYQGGKLSSSLRLLLSNN